MNKYLLILCLTFVVKISLAQPYKTIKPQTPYKWMVGVSWAVIEDDGTWIPGLLNAPKSWNILPYPSKISLDRYFKFGWSAELAVTYQQYKGATTINGRVGAPGMFLGVDANGKYSFYQKYAPRARWIDPYFTFGLGYTMRSSSATNPHTLSLNVGLGFNFWIYGGFGVQLHSNANFSMAPTFFVGDNYFQHSAGLVYRWEKGKQKNHSDKARYPWTKDRKNYKNKTGH